VRRAALPYIIERHSGLIFQMQGETDRYFITVDWGVNADETSPPDLAPTISCDCPDSIGICKHICWLVFKVLRHDGLRVFATRELPLSLVGPLFDSAELREGLEREWGQGDSGSFMGGPDT